jgi:hypothetical protein
MKSEFNADEEQTDHEASSMQMRTVAVGDRQAALATANEVILKLDRAIRLIQM